MAFSASPKYPNNHVTVENIINVDIGEFGYWVRDWVLGIRIPQPNANTTPSSIMPRINELLSEIPNRASLATELYSIITGYMAQLKVAKSNKKLITEEMYKETEQFLALATAKQDILYRAWQQLEMQYKAASRMVGVQESELRGAGGR